LENKLRDSNQDPDQWIQSLEGMQRRLQILGHKFSEMDMIIHILQNLTKEYDTTAEILENNLDNDLASLDRVKEKLRARFEKIQKTRPNQDGAFMVKDIRSGKYKGLCSFCGMYWHKAVQCRTKLKGMNEKQEGEKEKNV
jgi:DNA replicative helicase MCM subunit Mcm2 (Cdc46/Mcm family)